MSCVNLTTDIDQAFEACFSSAVLRAWKRTSQTYESGFSSNSILVRQGRCELCKPERAQSFGRGWLSFTTPVLARALFSCTLRSTLRTRICRGCTILVLSKIRYSFPALVFFQVGWVPFGVLFWVTWPEPRCWGSQNNFGWLACWKMLWNWYMWSILCLLSSALVPALPCSRVAQIGRKTVRSRISLGKNRMGPLRIRRIRGRSLVMRAAELVVVAEILGGEIVFLALRE